MSAKMVGVFEEFRHLFGNKVNEMEMMEKTKKREK